VRVLLDECLPRRLKRELPGHDAKTAPEMGPASKRNGELLHLAERDFVVFLTVDGNLEHQQNLARFAIAVIVLIAPSSRFQDLQPLMQRVFASLALAKPGKALLISSEGDSTEIADNP
jgi:predicted nuclease of predicted toxin-antitoxin system